MADRFFIGPYNSGLVRDKKPFLIPDEAFETLRNVYVFRDRVKKRFGSRVMNGSVDPTVQQLYSRFRVKLNNLYGNPAATNGAGDFTGTVPVSAPLTPIATPAIGQLFSVGDDIFTVNALGNPAALLSTGAGAGTFDTTTGALVITGASPATDVYYYPALPVMGLITRDNNAINNEDVIGFDTCFAYQYSGIAWERLDPAYYWTGTNSDFFWGENWRGNLPQERALFVTNYTAADGMAYLDPTTSTFTQLAPYYINEGPGPLHFQVVSARIIVPFQGRLVLLNTIEQVAAGDATFRNRARWSQNGNPLEVGNPAIANDGGWLEPPRVFGRGDHLDAPTSEAIVSASILKDRLIVYFERSTWELVYTSNQVLPFVWQTINIELGAESTFSVVPFDKALLGIGDVGVHSCNGANVDRIDEKIPDYVFELQNINQGPERVYGVRDYSTEMVYWAVAVETSQVPTIYPNQVLVYNYRNGSWAINDDSITCFGQYQFDTTLRWNSTYTSWEDSSFSWNSGLNNALSRNIIAGNQQGFTFIIDNDINQTSTNAHALSVTDITEAGYIAVLTIVDHNLTLGDFILVDYLQADNDPNNTIEQVNNRIYQVAPNSKDEIAIQVETNFDPGAVYLGGGTVRRVSQIYLKTKQYNFYLDQGVSFTINKIDFLVDKAPSGQVTVNTYTNSASIIADASILTTAAYSATYAPMEQWQESVWHTLYPNAHGSFLQFEITVDDEQILDRFIADADFVLNAMVISSSVTASRLQ